MTMRVIGYIRLDSAVLADEALQSASLAESTAERVSEAREKLRPWVARYGAEVLGLRILLGSRVLTENGGFVLPIECTEGSPDAFDDEHFWQCMMAWTSTDRLPLPPENGPAPDLRSGHNGAAMQVGWSAGGSDGGSPSASVTQARVMPKPVGRDAEDLPAKPGASEASPESRIGSTEQEPAGQRLAVSAGAACGLANAANRRATHQRRTVTPEAESGVVQELIDLHELRRGKKRFFTTDVQLATAVRAGIGGREVVASDTGQHALVVRAIKLVRPEEREDDSTDPEG